MLKYIKNVPKYSIFVLYQVIHPPVRTFFSRYGMNESPESAFRTSEVHRNSSPQPPFRRKTRSGRQTLSRRFPPQPAETRVRASPHNTRSAVQRKSACRSHQARSAEVLTTQSWQGSPRRNIRRAPPRYIPGRNHGKRAATAESEPDR